MSSLFITVCLYLLYTHGYPDTHQNIFFNAFSVNPSMFKPTLFYRPLECVKQEKWRVSCANEHSVQTQMWVCVCVCVRDVHCKKKHMLNTQMPTHSLDPLLPGTYSIMFMFLAITIIVTYRNVCTIYKLLSWQQNDVWMAWPTEYFVSSVSVRTHGSLCSYPTPGIRKKITFFPEYGLFHTEEFENCNNYIQLNHISFSVSLLKA